MATNIMGLLQYKWKPIPPSLISTQLAHYSTPSWVGYILRGKVHISAQVRSMILNRKYTSSWTDICAWVCVSVWGSGWVGVSGAANEMD